MLARPCGSVPSRAASSLNFAAAWSSVHPRASRCAWRRLTGYRRDTSAAISSSQGGSSARRGR